MSTTKCATESRRRTFFLSEEIYPAFFLSHIPSLCVFIRTFAYNETISVTI